MEKIKTTRYSEGEKQKEFYSLTEENILGASFRDPDGFLFMHHDTLYRQINQSGAVIYEQLMQSGLYADLVSDGMLISHIELPMASTVDTHYYKIIRPEKIPFISYPYEWSFSQLQAAALLTLAIQKKALSHGMSLKDASAYNIQWIGARPIFIDTLSFERYKNNTPWIAYRQFCKHFLAPLALMRYCNPSLGQLLKMNLDGIPLDVASTLLPLRAFLRPSLFFHIFLHARMQKRHAHDTSMSEKKFSMSKQSLEGMIDYLYTSIASLGRHTTSKLSLVSSKYFRNETYTSVALEHKKELVRTWVNDIKPKTIWDIGANDGLFSRLVAAPEALVISSDQDPIVIEENYALCQKEHIQNVFSLVSDITNPSPGLGWSLNERQSIFERIQPDMILFLALIHHLVLTQNIPMDHIAKFLGSQTDTLIIEFVPPQDSVVQFLMQQKEKNISLYNIEHFEQVFGTYFTIKEKVVLHDSVRSLYIMQTKNSS